MTEFVIIGTFAVLLIIGTVLSVPLIYTLLMGFALFFSYGISRSISAKALLRSAAKSIWEVRSVIALFAIVGAMSAAWRASEPFLKLSAFHPTCSHPQFLYWQHFFYVP